MLKEIESSKLKVIYEAKKLEEEKWRNYENMINKSKL